MQIAEGRSDIKNHFDFGRSDIASFIWIWVASYYSEKHCNFKSAIANSILILTPSHLCFFFCDIIPVFDTF